MSKEEKRAPEVRFEGFHDDWKQRKLTNLVSVIKSYPLSRSVETEKNTGVRYIHYGDIHTKRADKITSKSNIPNINVGDYKYLEKDDLALADASEDYQGIAMPSVIVEKTPFRIVAGLHTIALRPKTIEPLYLYYLIHSSTFRKYGYKVGTGMKVFGISKNNILKFETLFPCIEEQTKISSLLNKIDDTIALHQEKLSKLQSLKEAALQSLFPQKNETEPKVRFTNFNELWKKHKLKDNTEMYDNLRIPVTKSERVHGNIPYYGANGIQDYVNNYTHDGEYVLIAEDGATDLINYPVNYIKGKAWVNNHAHVLSGRENRLDNLFLHARLKTMNISAWLVGGSRAKLNGGVLRELPLVVPAFVEQQKIGNFFQQLDNSITLYQSKLEKLQTLKKVFLQKMFI